MAFKYYETEQKLKFHISDLLSVTTATVLSLNENAPIMANGQQLPPRLHSFTGTLNLLEYMTKETVRDEEGRLYQHALTDFMPAAKEGLLRQFPFLRDVAAPDLLNIPKADFEKVHRAFIAEQATRAGGEYFEVESLQPQPSPRSVPRKNGPSFS